MRKKLAQLRSGELPLCKFYQPYHSFLRTPGEHTRLSFNKKSFSYLERMKQTAASYKIAYLTSNQTFSRESLFIIKKDFKDHRWIDESYGNAQTYRGYINPQIDQHLGDEIEVWQRCMSFPYIECKVKRHQQVKVSYVDQKRENIKQQMFGFKAVLYQHCMDHLKGKCTMDWNVSRGAVRLYPESEMLFPRTKLVLKDYSFKIKQAISKRKDLKQNEQIVMTEQQKKMQEKEEEILRKYFQEQINIMSQKYSK